MKNQIHDVFPYANVSEGCPIIGQSLMLKRLQSAGNVTPDGSQRPAINDHALHIPAAIFSARYQKASSNAEPQKDQLILTDDAAVNLIPSIGKHIQNSIFPID